MAPVFHKDYERNKQFTKIYKAIRIRHSEHSAFRRSAWVQGTIEQSATPPVCISGTALYTETAVLKVLTDILLAVDSGDLSVLALLDLSAAFDTVDYHILLARLRISFGIDGAALAWLQSYLTGRVETVRCGSTRSTTTTVWYGVPHGSVLGPLLFIMYTAGLIDIIESHGLCPHLYADDTQIQGSCRPGSVRQLQTT